MIITNNVEAVLVISIVDNFTIDLIIKNFVASFVILTLPMNDSALLLKVTNIFFLL